MRWGGDKKRGAREEEEARPTTNLFLKFAFLICYILKANRVALCPSIYVISKVRDVCMNVVEVFKLLLAHLLVTPLHLSIDPKVHAG